MKIKLKCFQTRHGKYEADLYQVKIGGIYEVARQCDSGEVSIKTPSGKDMSLFTSEFEYIMEA